MEESSRAFRALRAVTVVPNRWAMLQRVSPDTTVYVVGCAPGKPELRMGNTCIMPSAIACEMVAWPS